MYEKYLIANNLESAVQFLAKTPETAKIIAGGTDLVLEIERGGHHEVKTLIDISRIRNLDQITLDSNEIIHIGPMVTHNGCLASSIIQKYARCLYQACEQVGAPQIRNRGTIAGNIATASPANDTIPVLLVLDANLELSSIRGKRIVPLNKFYKGVRKTALEKDEIISDIQFKKPENNEFSAFKKNGLRNAQAISVINTAVMVKVENNTIISTRIALGSVAPTIVRSYKAENYLTGKSPSEEVFSAAGDLALEEVDPISDIRASGDYRRNMIKVYVKRTLTDAVIEQKKVDSTPVLLWGKEKTANCCIDLENIEINTGTSIQVEVNGKPYFVENAFEKNLLDLLRENLNLTGTKEGCGEGECGACTVYMDGVAVLACLIPAPRANGAKITTIEGLSSTGKITPVQQSFIDEGAVQCGYCTPGFVMSAEKLLEEKPNPTSDEIKTAISGNLCRCTGYYKIIQAIEKAAAR